MVVILWTVYWAAGGRNGGTHFDDVVTYVIMVAILSDAIMIVVEKWRLYRQQKHLVKDISELNLRQNQVSNEEMYVPERAASSLLAL